MLSRKEELNLQFRLLLDYGLFALAFWSAHALRFYAASWFAYDKPIGPFHDFLWLFVVVVPLGPNILEMQGFYARPLQKRFSQSLEQYARTLFWLGLIIALCSYFLRWDVPSRAVMPLFAIFAGILLLGHERITELRLLRRVRQEARREPVILAGTPEDLHQFRHTFTPQEIMSLEVVQEIDLETQPLSELISALHTHSVSRVLFAGGHSHLNRLEAAILACEVEGVEAWLAADFIRTAIARPSFDVFGTRPMLVFRTTPELSWALLVKAALDRTGAAVGLILAAVPMLLIALAIRITSVGPVVFRQKRSGKNGRPFTMYKFRSMDTDAAMRQAELAAFNVMEGPVFKLEQDPRVTPIGRFLRRTSLDELPQLVNVLRGEMSLVGPRPLPIYEVEKFESPAHRRRLSMKPGLTCLWQISGRNKIVSFSDWVKLDLNYIDNWSLWLDLKILLKTVPVVVLGWGAK